jgi:UDP-N-acetylmuramoylalanine--D-glutamate ligase
MERAEDHQPLRDRGHHLRLVQFDDVEAAVMAISPTNQFDVRGKRVTVTGAARSGLAATELLMEHGARVTLSDVRSELAEASGFRARGVQVELGGHRTETFTGADLVVLSPGVPPDLPVLEAARARGVPVVGEVEFASRFLRGRVIAITGTKGKSTTTALTGRMLAAAGFPVTVGGNIGSPLSSQVADSTPETLHVVETSSFQLEQIDSFHPWIAVMLNFSPDHLDRHPTVAAYAAAKARIFANQQSGDWAVINADDPAVLQLAQQTRAAIRLFGRRTALARGTTVQDGWVVAVDAHRTDRLVPLTAVHLLGPHLVDDVLAAATVGVLAGASPLAMTVAVDGFRGLEHAMELVAEVAGVRSVNDSKATNVAAALRSIESFDRGLVAIIGGRFKGGDLRLLRQPLSARATAVVAIGEAAGLIEDALSGAVTVRRARALDEAVDAAYALARPAGVVLLAPACSSFDMFDDYADRGRRFKAEVARIARTES